MELISFIGQLIIGAMFALAAITDTMDYQPLLALLEKNRIPFKEILLPGAILLKLLCGLALVFNYYVSLAALLLAGFVLIANIIFHPFWKLKGNDRKREYMQFLVHVIVIGGLLALVGK